MTTPTGVAVHQHRLKIVTFTLAGVDFSCQLNSWTLNNNTVDGVKTFTYCPDSEFRTETDNDYSLTMKFYSDWRSGGISDYLWNNSRAIAAFVLDHHPDLVGEHVRWSGNCVIKAPTVGGDVRTTEETSQTLLILGLPIFARIG
jgi:hypothetical protein